jgi:DNA-binding transcriptional LysR family regulator
MGIELRHLRSFMAVADERSFTRAAERLHMAQPPLSQRVRQLEEDLGVVLFERHTRKVALSKAGQVFYDEVKKTLAQLELAVDSCRRVSRGDAGLLRLGYSGRASHLLLPRLLLALRTQFPDIALDLDGPHPSGTLKAKLLDRQLDVALCFLPLIDREIACRDYVDIDFVLVLPSDHPLAGSAELDLSAFASEPFVAYPGGKGFLLRDAMDEQCARAGFAPRVVRESENSQVLMCLVAAGVGVSIVPRELQYQEEIVGLAFKRLGPDALRLTHGMAWRRDNTNPALRSLLSLDLHDSGSEVSAEPPPRSPA